MGAGQESKGMGMIEQPYDAAQEREEIAARVASFKATQEKFAREREEYFVTRWKTPAPDRSACRSGRRRDFSDRADHPEFTTVMAGFAALQAANPSSLFLFGEDRVPIVLVGLGYRLLPLAHCPCSRVRLRSCRLPP